MKKEYFLSIPVAVIAFSIATTTVNAQDPVIVDAKHYKVIAENENVRVLRIKYGPGEKSVMHYHPEGVAVFLTDFKGEFLLPDGSSIKNDAKAGDVVLAPEGKHLPQIGNKAIEVIQVELKSAKTPRWTTTAAEIDVSKALVKDYQDGNWASWSKHYADTAKSFHNTTTGITPAALQEGLQATIKKLASYRFSDKEIFYERVVDNNGDTWVYFWATWEGKTAAGSQDIVVPVHIALKFVNNKIVREYAYYDASKFADLK